MFHLSDEKHRVLDEPGHLLIMGGPGSGKTTIALLKAKRLVESGVLKNEQSVLFLSFARSTVARVEQQSQTVIDDEVRKRIEVTTYHSFTWSILRNNGYLLNAQKLEILLPSEASVALSKCENATERETEKRRLFDESGKTHFDLFASKCHEILSQCDKLLRIVGRAYPFVILDEFQDTNSSEWDLMNLISKHSTLIALADPEQRIYDFRGADPARIKQYIDSLSPEVFDFGTENNRSNGTDIVAFGNDLLAGRNIEEKYNDVIVYTYGVLKGNAQLLKIKGFLFQRIRHLSEAHHNEWSIAVLVPSNSLMITLSEILGNTQHLSQGRVMPPIQHEVAIDVAGPALAATFIAHILELGSQHECHFTHVVSDLCEHILGRRGEKTPSKADSTLTTALQQYIEAKNYSKPIRGKNRQEIVSECREISDSVNELTLTGNVAQDWISVRNLFSEVSAPSLMQIYKDSFFIKLLHKGTLLNSSLGQLWRRNGHYSGAADAVKEALTREHFASSATVWRGVNVMTIHKSKGKEFNEVIVYEGSFQGQRFVFSDNDDEKARLSLRVAATRAQQKVFFFTPKNDPCHLLV